MKAQVIKTFMGVPDGALHPRRFEPGDSVEGDLARVAMAEGWAEVADAPPVFDREPARRRPTGR